MIYNYCFDARSALTISKRLNWIMDQLLTTKLNIPRTRSGIVPRLHLIKRLNGGLERKLSLISAPAGFGKTTLVTEWIDELRNPINNRNLDQLKIGWLSLDEGDNDPLQFIAYMIAALNRAAGEEDLYGKGELRMLQSHQPPAVETILVPLINEISNVKGKLVIVFDDYHVVNSSEINQILSFLLENQPPQLHLVIASREDPNLPLPRYRARAQMTELRAVDLRFSTSEAADFLNQVMGLNLAQEDIAALERRTEGWIAGLQLAAVSLSGKDQPRELIKSFSGSHRIVLDYLIEEVLHQQPAEIQLFLLQTAILSRMNAAICDALTGLTNGQETLEYLEQANLFIIPLDEERQWYRYHHLFSDLLVQRLKQLYGNRIPELHLRASRWLQANGQLDAAVEHALRAGDYEQVSSLVEDRADDLWMHGEHYKLRRWLEQTPDDFIRTKPLLSISQGYYLHSAGHHQAGDEYLQAAEFLFDPPDSKPIVSKQDDQHTFSDQDRLLLRSRLAVIRSLICTFTGDIPGMLQGSSKALELLDEQDSTWRCLAAFTLGDAYSYLGDMNASYQARAEALRACEAEGDLYYVVVASLKLAATLYEQGELQQTLDLCKRTLGQVSQSAFAKSSPVGCLMVLFGDVLAEMNDTDQAQELATRGVQISERGGNLTLLGYSFLYKLRVLLARKDFDQAREVFTRVSQLNHETTVPAWLTNQMANWQARINLEQNQLHAAEQWLEEQGIAENLDAETITNIDYLKLFDFILIARILIAQQGYDQAISILQAINRIALKGGRTMRVIEILNLEALAFAARGDISGAMIPLERSLEIAEPLGFKRSFADEGPPMAGLLKEARSRGIYPGYATQLLLAFTSVEPPAKEDPSPSAMNASLIEPLSDREIEVLQLLAEGLTNLEIANQLYISLNTVKVHTRNIYGKLGTSNRTQAVSTARSKGILTNHNPTQH
jgi:LuxR family maltose regulon positive regulatory protein